MDEDSGNDRESAGRLTTFRSMGMSRSRDFGLPAILMAALSLFLFTGSLNYDFVWDDEHLVRYVRQVVHERGPGGLLTAPFMKSYADRPGSRQYYRPVTLVSMWANQPRGKPVPFPYHLFNVLLHAANTLLVFALLRRILPHSAGAVMGGVIFAVHPVHAESVSWISGRTDMLAAFFVLLTLIIWLRHRREQGRSFIVPLLLSLVSFSLACLSKEVAFLLPFIVLFWSLSDRPAQGKSSGAVMARDGKWIMSWLAVACLWFFLRLVFLGSQEGLKFLPAHALNPLALPGLLAKISCNLLLYIRLLFFPLPLAVYYPPSLSCSMLPMTLTVALIIVPLCLGIAGRRHGRIGLLVLSWLTVFLLPVSGIADLGLSRAAERFCYLPSVGASLLAGYLLGLMWNRVEIRKPLMAAYTAVMVLLVTGSIMHSGRWADETTLFSSALRGGGAKVPNMHFNLGTAYMRAGEYVKAKESLERALLLEPQYVDAMYNLASVLILTGEHDRSYDVITMAQTLAPEDPRFWSIRGVVLELTGQTSKALEAYSRTMELDPHDAEAGYHMGRLLLRLERQEESAAVFKKVLSIQPDHLGAALGMGQSMEERGEFDTAERIYMAAVERHPEEVLPYKALGRLFLQQQKPREAGAVYRTAYHLDPSDPDVNRGIVIAAVSAGDIHMAMEHLDRIRSAEPDLYRSLIAVYPEIVDPAGEREK